MVQLRGFEQFFFKGSISRHWANVLLSEVGLFKSCFFGLKKKKKKTRYHSQITRRDIQNLVFVVVVVVVIYLKMVE